MLIKYFPLITAILWGTSYIATKFALPDFSPMTIATGRSLIAYLALVLFYLLIGKKEYLIPRKSDLLPITLISLSGVVFFWWFLNLGLKYTTTTNAALIVSSNPLIVTILAPLMLKEAVTRREWLGVVIGLIGCYIVISRGQIIGLFHSGTLPGDAISLVAGLFFALYVLLSRKFTSRLHPGYLTVNSFGFGAVIFGLLSLASGNFLTLWQGSNTGLGAIAWLGLICSAVPFLLLSTALEKIRAAKASVYIFVSPVIAALLAYILLNEKIGPGPILGGSFIIAGILITVLAKTGGGTIKQNQNHCAK